MKYRFIYFQKPDRKTMRANQTGNYLNFKEDFEKALSTVNTDKPRDFRLNVDITTPDDSRSTGILSYFWPFRSTYRQVLLYTYLLVTKMAWHCVNTGHKEKRFSLHVKRNYSVTKFKINFGYLWSQQKS